MNKFRKFWIIFLSFLPFGANAIAPVLVGILAGIGVTAGFSIYRTAVPTDMVSALNLFSGCWSCGMFSDIVKTLANIIPGVYGILGKITVPMVAGLTAVWFAWVIVSGFLGIGGKADVESPAKLTIKFGSHMMKMTLVIALLLIPLPQIASKTVIEPIFNIGLSLNRVVNNVVLPDTERGKYESCIISTALNDSESAIPLDSQSTAFSPNFRHQLACQLSDVHRLTGLGLATGWTMLNSAFDGKYMHKILSNVAIFPNVGLLLGGGLILVLFFMALIPIPLYFLEVIVELAMDFIMLPLLLVSWLFGDNWKIVKLGDGNIKKIVDRVIQGVCGIALVGVFVSFSALFLRSIFGNNAGMSNLEKAFSENNPEILIDGLLAGNDSIISIALFGLFIAAFMNAIPALIKTLFKNVELPQNYSKDLQGRWKQLQSGGKQLWKSWKK
ncbi:MAG: hypothetical protein LBO08_01045 [Rickettsiales bacterium]|jgi:hypothetical protein|nr:hypothetical protein [Rickettsiales bacterium]